MSRDIVIYKGSRQFVVDVIKDLEKRLDALEGDDGEKGKAMSNEREAFEAAWEEFQDKDLTSSNRIQAHAWFLKGYRSASQSADDEFKNFHRLLCERFGYSHDEKHWKRDQLSLIEWIAARQSAGATGQEPVAEVVLEQDYWSRGHFYEGTRHVLRTLADINNLAVGTKLYTARASAVK